MLLSCLLLLAASAPFAFADVEFTTPAAGATLTAGGTIAVAWKDSGDAPSISDLSTYQLFLCAGGNDDDNFIQLTQLTGGTAAGSFSAGNSLSATVSAGVGASETNAYFLKMVSVATAGGTVTNFSPRFSITGMTGTFPPNVIAGIQTITGTAGPATVNDVSDTPAAGGAAAAGAAGFSVAYTLQTGLTKYAPMQPQPPTSITATNTSPLFPTSSVSIATTWLPTPSQVTTFTQSGTYSVSSMENTAAPVAQPSDDMAKFLARWKD